MTKTISRTTTLAVVTLILVAASSVTANEGWTLATTVLGLACIAMGAYTVVDGLRSRRH